MKSGAEDCGGTRGVDDAGDALACWAAEITEQRQRTKKTMTNLNSFRMNIGISDRVEWRESQGIEFLPLLHFFLHLFQIFAGKREIGIDLQGALEMRFCFVKVAQFRQGAP